MSKFENMAFYIGSGADRAKNAEAVENFLQSKGYRSYEYWNQLRRDLGVFNHIVSYKDGDYSFHAHSEGAPLHPIPHPSSTKTHTITNCKTHLHLSNPNHYGCEVESCSVTFDLDFVEQDKLYKVVATNTKLHIQAVLTTSVGGRDDKTGELKENEVQIDETIDIEDDMFMVDALVNNLYPYEIVVYATVDQDGITEAEVHMIETNNQHN